MSDKNTKFELKNVDDLIPYARNARTHTPEQVQKLASSIKEFGFINPVIISDDGGVLAGHGRIMAAQKLGIKQVPCVIESHLTDAQKKAYILADNRLALDAGWDSEMLKIELNDLKQLNFDLDLIGFNTDELKELVDDFTENEYFSDSELSEDGEEPVEVNDEEESITQPGDVWILGNHRVICGSCTDPEIVKKVMGDDKPNLMVTDPPYGVNYDPTQGLRGKTGHFSEGFSGKVYNDDRDDWTEAYSLFKGNIAYVWYSSLHSDVVMTNIKTCGFKISSMIIWNKNIMTLSGSDYQWKHEHCIYATRGNHNWKGGRVQTTVWDITVTRFAKEGEWGHGTQKPIECMRRPIENNSDPDEYIYDPFLGSGTTVIAAERTGRRCIGCELMPKYCDAIVKRWQAETGKKAVLQGDGTTFDELCKN